MFANIREIRFPWNFSATSWYQREKTYFSRRNL